MIKHWQSMQDYKCFLRNSKVSFDSSERIRLHTELWRPWQKLRLLDIDIAMDFLLPFYSSTGRPAKNQPQILRSFLLFFFMVSMGLTSPSLTRWVSNLSHDRVLDALIGCPLDSLPPLGSYFDFMDRLWVHAVPALYSRKKLLPASWNSARPDKPNGKHQKAVERSINITERIAARVLNHKDILFNFESRLQTLFYRVAVLPSLHCGVIPSDSLTVSGDGTAVHTHANPHGKHTKEQLASLSPEELSFAPRHYSDPDARWGWDSGLDQYYFGYTLFQLSCYNPSLRTDVPLLLRFTSAKRHDSVCFLTAFHEMEKHMPSLSVKNMCLDSAMDNMPTYRLLKKRGIRAFIDLNSKCGRPKIIPDTIRIDKNGTPLCNAGRPMVPYGQDRSTGYLMWRCPFGKDHVSKCPQNCSNAKYGRVIKTRPEWDIRLYTDVPRGTEAYRRIYSQRTATERINNRILNDYGLQRMRIHRKDHYSFYATMIGICIHLDARFKQQTAA